MNHECQHENLVDFLCVEIRKIRPETWQKSLLMVRSLRSQDLNTNSTRIQRI